MRKRPHVLRNCSWGLLLSLQLLLGATGVASAEATTTQIELTLPDAGKVGQQFMAKALLTHDGGSPVAGVKVVFAAAAEFANVKGEIELGGTSTDEQGVASFSYLPRSSGVQTITARFAGNGQYAAAESSSAISIDPGPQVHYEESGVRVPGVGVWLLAAALAVVWAAFLVVALLLGYVAGVLRGGLPYRG